MALESHSGASMFHMSSGFSSGESLRELLKCKFQDGDNWSQKKGMTYKNKFGEKMVVEHEGKSEKTWLHKMTTMGLKREWHSVMKPNVTCHKAEIKAFEGVCIVWEENE